VDERTGRNKAEAASGDLPDDKAWSVAWLEFGMTIHDHARLVDALLAEVVLSSGGRMVSM
jgi:hypothetical protein